MLATTRRRIVCRPIGPKFNGMDGPARVRSGLPQGCVAHLADDDADRQAPDAGLPAHRGRARRTLWRRAGAALGPRELFLSAARRARQSIRPLDLAAGNSEGRHGLPDDAEPARIHGLVALP